MPKHDVAQAMLKQSELEADVDTETDLTRVEAWGTPCSLPSRIYNAQGVRPLGFTFTPMPPNASPAQECAIWIYDDMRLEELGL